MLVAAPTRSEYLRSMNSDSDSISQDERKMSIAHVGYVSVLHAGEWLTPNQYLVEYDSNGDPVWKFGLDASGLLGLWHDDDGLVWRPENKENGSAVRCHKLKFQQANGHLTCYLVFDGEGDSYAIEHTWKTKCKDDDYELGQTRTRKITLADGDVNQFDDNGAVVWTLPGSHLYSGEPIEPVCRPELISE